MNYLIDRLTEFLYPNYNKYNIVKDKCFEDKHKKETLKSIHKDYYENTYGNLKSISVQRDRLAYEFIKNECNNIKNIDIEEKIKEIDKNIIKILIKLSKDNKITQRYKVLHDLPNTVKYNQNGIPVLNLYDEEYDTYSININNIIKI